MKQVIQNLKTGRLAIEDVPPPRLQATGLLVRNRYSLVSAGTERAVIEFAKQSLAGKAKNRPDLVKQVLNKIKTDGLAATIKTVTQRIDTPLALGYSCAGTVAAVGERVEGFQPGDPVACGGAGYASHAETVYVPANLCAKIPGSVTAAQAAFVTLGAIAMQGIRTARLTPGEKTAVIGLGLIGQLTVQILNAYGFPVMGMDIDSVKLERAGKLGLSAGVLLGKEDSARAAAAFTRGRGIDAVLITAATKSSEPVALAGRICRDRGRVSAVGDIGLNIPRALYYGKELELCVSRSYGPGRYDPLYEEKGHDYPFGYVRWTENRNMEEFLRLVETGRIDVDAMVTHVFGIDDALDAYQLILENPDKQEVGGVLLEYPKTEPSPSRVDIPSGKPGRRPARQTVTVGLVGAGSFASTVILPALKRLSNASIRAVADLQGPRAKSLAGRYGCDYATSNHQDLLADPDIDLVVIATRHDRHAPLAIEALKAGKYVHLEKPMAMNPVELGELVETARDFPGRLMVGFNRRFAPAVAEAERVFSGRNTPMMLAYRVNAGFIPRTAWVHDPEEGGGRIVGEVCHFVDLLQHLTGSPPHKVFASRVSAPEPVVMNDNVLVTLDFQDGSRGMILYTSMGGPSAPKEMLDIYADGAVFTINNFRTCRIYRGNSSRGRRGRRQDKGHNREFENLVRAVSRGEPAPIPLEEQTAATLATFKILESLEKRAPVAIDPGSFS